MSNDGLELTHGPDGKELRVSERGIVLGPHGKELHFSKDGWLLDSKELTVNVSRQGIPLPGAPNGPIRSTERAVYYGEQKKCLRVNGDGQVIDSHGVVLPVLADGRLMGWDGEALPYGVDGKPLGPGTDRLGLEMMIGAYGNIELVDGQHVRQTEDEKVIGPFGELICVNRKGHSGSRRRAFADRQGRCPVLQGKERIRGS
jgi:hypothetical protein